jgi:hypothetical protein
MSEHLAPAPSQAGLWGYGGWEEHPLGVALERYLLGKQQLGKPLEKLGVPRWNARRKLTLHFPVCSHAKSSPSSLD